MRVIPLFEVGKIAVDQEPIVILGRASLLHDVGKVFVRIVAMVEYRIEHDAHPPRVRFVQ